MSWQAVLMYCAVAFIGFPAMLRNLTAAALVVAWLVPEILYQFTGDSLPTRIYFMADIAVITAIYAKSIVRSGAKTYPIITKHFRGFIFDLTPWDRLVVAIFMLGCWPLYILDINPWWKWHALWLLTIAQYLSAGAEAALSFRHELHERAADEPPGFALAGVFGRYG